ncbi:hypothetical protein HID58_080372, partial [Brassica napus]
MRTTLTLPHTISRPQILSASAAGRGIRTRRQTQFPASTKRTRVVINPKQQLEPVKISLKDCLACRSLLPQQFLSVLTKTKDVIVSLSPQSRASLAVYYDISSLQDFKKLTTRDLLHIEACNEFASRYKQASSEDCGENSQSPLTITLTFSLQNIVRRVKTGKCEYQYVEIMACPAGASSVLCKNLIWKKSWLRCAVNGLPDLCWAVSESTGQLIGSYLHELC